MALVARSFLWGLGAWAEIAFELAESALTPDVTV